MHDIDDDIY